MGCPLIYPAKLQAHCIYALADSLCNNSRIILQILSLQMLFGWGVNFSPLPTWTQITSPSLKCVCFMNVSCSPSSLPPSREIQRSLSERAANLHLDIFLVWLHSHLTAKQHGLQKLFTVHVSEAKDTSIVMEQAKEMTGSQSYRYTYRVKEHVTSWECTGKEREKCTQSRRKTPTSHIMMYNGKGIDVELVLEPLKNMTHQFQLLCIINR